jgi:hypothetical protein
MCSILWSEVVKFCWCYQELRKSSLSSLVPSSSFDVGVWKPCPPLIQMLSKKEKETDRTMFVPIS